VPYVEKTGVNYAIIDNPLPEGYVWSYTDSTMKYEGINDMIDELSAEWAVDKIKHLTNDDGGPFFLAVGIVRPHAPLYCPRKYFDMVPSAQDTLLDFDAAAVCEGANFAEDERCGSQKLCTAEDKSMHTGSKYFSALKRAYANDPARGLKEHKQAYHACKAFAMAQVEKVLDAIDESPFSDNTIVIAISDNGLSNGLHEFVYKNNVWEDATHVPLYIRAPGIAKAGTIVDQPVTLVDIYPTLKDLCGLSTDTVRTASGASLDGHSLRPLLEGSASAFWAGPSAAASMAYAEFQSRGLPEECHTDPTCHHWAVRTKEKRYILFNNGQEELYDLVNDPHEMIDLSQKSPAAVKEMRHELVRTTGLDVSQLGKQR
jgi:arylsulfatase A-like enzyme